MDKQLIAYNDKLIKWINNYAKKAKITSFVLGISGGIDSALALAILTKTNFPVYGVFLDIENSILDKECVLQLKKKFKFNFLKYNLEKEWKNLIKKLQIKNEIAMANLKTRLRANSLYAIANQYNALVVGTTNACEKLVGYYTKNGDNACDLSILVNLLKQEIYQLSVFYGIPEIIIKRKPSASLYEGQEDEKEMGITYKQIDNFLLKTKNSKEIDKKISLMNKNNKHKTFIAELKR